MCWVFVVGGAGLYVRVTLFVCIYILAAAVAILLTNGGKKIERMYE